MRLLWPAPSKGIYVTPRSFTPEAEDYAAHAPITLVDGRLLIKSMQLSRKGVLLPQTDKAMCRQCGDIVQHSLAKDDHAEACINGHLVAPTISRAALIPYRPSAPAAGEQPAAPAPTFIFAMHPAGPHPTGSGPVIKPRNMSPKAQRRRAIKTHNHKFRARMIRQQQTREKPA
jgi:Restriction endonuclease